MFPFWINLSSVELVEVTGFLLVMGQYALGLLTGRILG